MRKALLGAVFIALFIPISSIYSQSYGEIMNQTAQFIESLEWDEAIHEGVDSYADYKEIYLDELSKDEGKLFLSSVMLGLLRVEKAAPILRSKLVENHTEAKAAVLFALAMINKHSSRKYIEELKSIAKNSQMVENAKSIKNLVAVELLSIVDAENFESYAQEFETDEVYQKEAISVSTQRALNIKAK